MELTSIRSSQTAAVSRSRDLLGSADVVVGNSVAIKGIRIVRLPSGRIELAMPSRPITRPCPHCNTPSPVMACFCSQCGGRLPADSLPEYRWADVTYPVSRSVRERWTHSILETLALPSPF